MKQNILILGISLVLFGCGGGGGGDDKKTTTVPTPVPQPLAVTVGTSVSSMDENTSAQITLSYANANGDVSLTTSDFSGDFENDQYTVTADNANKQITIAMNDIYVDGDLSFTVTATDTANIDSVSITLSVVNTSVVAILEKLSVLTTSYEGISSANEGRNVLERLNDVSILLGTVNESTALAKMESVDTLLNEAAGLVLADNLQNKDYTTLYSEGMSEIAINEVLSSVELNLPLYSEELYSLIIETQQSLGASLVAPFLENAFYVDSTSNTVSRFWMNPSMGEIVDGNYQFSDTYAYLEAVLFPEAQNCNQ